MFKIPPKSWINSKIEGRDVSNKGKGLFAVDNIVEGEDILIWGGSGYTNDEATVEQARKEGKLIMKWDENLYSIEERGEDGPEYFINHSCEPNTWMKDTFTIIARRNIEKGEEITIDYVMFIVKDDDYVSSWICKCGDRECRGRVRGNDWKNKSLQLKYKGHFIPYINNKIKNEK